MLCLLLKRKTLLISLLFSISNLLIAQQNHPTAKLEIGYNGPLESPESPVRWISGGIGPGHAHYSEGQSIPFRVVMKNLPVANTITLDIGFGVVQANKYAIDFVTTYDFLNPHNYINHTSAELIDPLAGYAVNSVPDQLLLPHPFPPLYVGNFPGALASYNFYNSLSSDQRSMYLWNGEFTDQQVGFTYYLVLERDVATNSVTDILDLNRNASGISLRVQFIASSSTAILAFGGHIARGIDWGQNNVGCSPCKAGLQSWDLNNLPASLTLNIQSNETSRTGGGICSFNDGGRPINPIGEPIIDIIPEVSKTEEFRIIPNPSHNHFNVILNSSDLKTPIQLRVMDMHGRIIKTYSNLAPGSTIQLGAEFRPGIYMVEMIQGNRRQQVKLLKQPN